MAASFYASREKGSVNMPDQKVPAVEDRLLTAEQVALFLGVSRNWIYRHSRPDWRYLNPLRLGRLLRFRRSVVIDILLKM